MRLFALLALLALSPAASAGIYNPNEPCPFEVLPDGTAKPLPLNVFKLLLNERVAALNPLTPEIQPGTVDAPTFKGVMARRLRGDSKFTDQIARSADLLRVGRMREVIELLKPPLGVDFRELIHLTMAHAALGDWDLAVKRGADAVLDGEDPTELAGTKPEQLKWMLKVDRTYTLPWLRASRRDADPRTKPTDPDVLPLFRPGEARPPDAVAIAQQMVLWAPLDTNLLWWLGAVYLEKGQFAEAFDTLEQCRERKLTWPKFRAQHAVAEAGYAKLPKVDPDETIAAPGADIPVEPQPRGLFALVTPEHFALVIGGFALMVLSIVYLQIRALRRRKRRRTKGA